MRTTAYVNDDSEQISRDKARHSSARLFALLQAVHEPKPEPEPYKAKPRKIPSAVIQRARDRVQAYGKAFSRADTIQRAVLSFYPDISLAELKSNCRIGRVVRPRQLAMFLIKELTTHTLPDIGRRFGGRDHTTVLHAITKMTCLCKTDPEIAAQAECVRTSLAEILA